VPREFESPDGNCELNIVVWFFGALRDNPLPRLPNFILELDLVSKLNKPLNERLSCAGAINFSS
jgi:hypothetical protein